MKDKGFGDNESRPPYFRPIVEKTLSNFSFSRMDDLSKILPPSIILPAYFLVVQLSKCSRCPLSCRHIYLWYSYLSVAVVDRASGWNRGGNPNVP
jgi:hypothetical protein